MQFSEIPLWSPLAFRLNLQEFIKNKYRVCGCNLANL